jgi:hypothetical protein
MCCRFHHKESNKEEISRCMLFGISKYHEDIDRKNLLVGS